LLNQFRLEPGISGLGLNRYEVRDESLDLGFFVRKSWPFPAPSPRESRKLAISDTVPHSVGELQRALTRFSP
jgi:hypothetical protein